MAWENLKYFIECLRNLSISESLNLKNGFCVSTGCDSGFENWVYSPDVIDDEDKLKVLEFFNKKNLPFAWPVKNNFKISGLFQPVKLAAMSYEPENKENKIYELDNNIKIEQVNNKSDSEIWGRLSWQGFGGNYDDVPKEYLNLSREYYKNENYFKIFIAKFNNINAGTFLLNEDKNLNANGIYYFAVIPEFRRCGVARNMMNYISGLKKLMLLQATPMGKLFYENYGFKYISDMNIFSNTTDL